MFNLLLWHVWKVFAIVASIIVSLAGCATTVTGTPVPQAEHVVANSPGGYRSDAATPGNPAKPANPGEQQASRELAPGVIVSSGDAPYVDTHRVARMVDPCALHDVAAAEAATGMGPDAIMPNPNGLHMCELTMAATPRDLPAWSLMVSVGIKFDEGRRAGFTPDQVGGMNVFHEAAKPGGGTTDTRTCRYVKPLGESSGIELLVRTGTSSTAPSKTPCDVAKEYLAMVAKFWKEPAMRADKLSTPAIPLADLDPCTGVMALAGELREAIKVQLPEPYTCQATPANGKAMTLSGILSVKLGVETDPRVLVGSPAGKDYKAVTVAGRAGVVREMDTKLGGAAGKTMHTCHVTVVADDKTAMQVDQARADSATTYQVIKTTSGDCAHGIKAIEAILATLR